MSDHPYRRFQQDSDRLYNHLLILRRQKDVPSEELVARFRELFVEGTQYVDRPILEALYRIVLSPWSDREFAAILSRCCYILINYWWSHPDLMQATIELVSMLKIPPYTPVTCQPVHRLRTLVQEFSQTELYAALQDRARVVEEAIKPPEDTAKRRLRELVPRYPFLYPHFLLNFDSSETGLNTVRLLQLKKERQFEDKLYQYTQNLVRRLKNPNGRAAATDVENPTLLTEEQLKTAIQKFAGKAEGSNTYQDLARQFVEESYHAKSHRVVKQQLYEYLVSSFQYLSDSKYQGYGERRFNRWLAQQLETMQPQVDRFSPNRSLLVQTCAHLIDCLIAKPSRLEDHVIFTDMTETLGATFIVGLLLKIVLLCRDVESNLDAIRSRLSHRFAMLLRHYETKVKGEISWLVECLETLLVAFSIHFGQSNFSSWVSML